MRDRTLLGVLILLTATSWLHGQSRPAGRTLFPAFDNVIALAKESTQGPSPVQLDLDVQVLVWAPTALLPAPFLRLTHAPGGDLQANMFVWWLQPAGVPSDRLPPNRRCGMPDQASPVCLAKIEVVGSVDWGELLANIFASRACSLSLRSGPVSVTTDAGDLVVRVYEANTDRYEEFKCNAPQGASRAGAYQGAQVMEVLQKAATAARRE
jgi:hypothetical protein